MPERAESDGVAARLDDIVALLAVMAKRDRPMSDVITDQSGLNIGPTRIARLFGTSPGYVDNVLARNKKTAAGSRPRAEEWTLRPIEVTRVDSNPYSRG